MGSFSLHPHVCSQAVAKQRVDLTRALVERAREFHLDINERDQDGWCAVMYRCGRVRSVPRQCGPSSHCMRDALRQPQIVTPTASFVKHLGTKNSLSVRNKCPLSIW